MNYIGTTVRGIRAPIIRKGDDLANIVVNTVHTAAKEGNFQLQDRDIVGITESVVARAQGNYATVDDIAVDIKEKFENTETLGLIHPIFSRNRFAICLRGIARAFKGKEIVLMLSYPYDEVGNAILDTNRMYPSSYYTHKLSLETFQAMFGKYKHPFTDVNYIDYYKDIIEGEGTKCTIIFSNQPSDITFYTNNILICTIHNYEQITRELTDKYNIIYNLTNILSAPVNNSGWNRYGLLGSNKVDENTIKLFPRNCTAFTYDVKTLFKNKTGKNIEVMVYGDGAFKDPACGIWELADPVVSPGYTEGLKGTPNELKLKYLADNQFASFSGDVLKNAIIESIKAKDTMMLKGNMASEGTTPRNYTDLLGSLCDLTSGSGDKGTPIVLIQNYFNNYAN